MNPFIARLFRTAEERQFVALVRPHIKALYRVVYRLAGSQADAEDILQDIFVKLLSKTEEIASIEKLKSWLIRVLCHEYIDNH